MEKRCRGCGESKAVTEFHKNKRAKDGLQGLCKPCHTLSVAASVARHKDREKAYRVEWRKRTADVVQARLQRHRDKRLAEDPDAFRREGAAKTARYRERHPERVKESRAKRNAANPGQSNDHNHRARAQKVGIVSYQKIVARDRDICYLCGESVVTGLPKGHPWSRSFDHVIALVNNGEHSNDNIRVAHYGCNLKKGRK